jgi:hypothetical protein
VYRNVVANGFQHAAVFSKGSQARKAWTANGSAASDTLGLRNRRATSAKNAGLST